MQSPGKPDLVTELIDLFLKDAETLITALRETVAKNDTKLLRRVTHQLKGSSANVGAKRLASLCEDLEANGIDEGTVKNILLDVEQEFEQVRKMLKTERQGIDE